MVDNGSGSNNTGRDTGEPERSSSAGPPREPERGGTRPQDPASRPASAWNPAGVFVGEVIEPGRRGGYAQAQGPQPEQAASAGYAEGPGVERQLAQFAFIREERDREVHLLFRDVPPIEIAHTFRAANAHFISMSGDRAHLPLEPEPPSSAEGEETTDEEDSEEAKRRARRRRLRRALYGGAEPQGEVTLRYYYGLGGTVYTVSIATRTGVVESIASLYPGAALLERELQGRLGIVFT